MKKLIIAAAIVCAAVVSHATTVTWGFNYDVLDATGSECVNGNAYVFFLGSEGTGTFTINSDGTYKLENGATLVSFEDTEAPAPIMEGVLYDGEALMSKVSANGKYAMVFLYQNPDADNAYYFNSLEATASGLSTEHSETKDILFGNSNIALSNPGEAVPEPTSGLLLLIGVAGLALRRRRA